MHIAFLNPQGNFDPQDRYWTAHPDFGGQLVYVKELALALGRMGHRVDILTRRIVDSEWQGFEQKIGGYPGEPNVRIVRLACGGDRFIRKEDLWPYIGTEWVPNIALFYNTEGSLPDKATAHYGDGGLAAAIWHQMNGPPYTFTGHSLGAQKLDRLLQIGDETLESLDAQYHFAQRLAGEQVAMNHAGRVISSTSQERFNQYGHPAYVEAVDTHSDSKFAIVTPGVNTHIFHQSPESSDDERLAAFLEKVLARDVAADRRTLPGILCSSRLDPKKNHIGLVRAFGGSVALQEAANLLIVVRGIEDIHSREGLTPTEVEVLDEIERIVQTEDLWGKVSVFSLESQMDLAGAYRYMAERRSVFTLTALFEPFGLAPLEAMACGLPVIVTKNGGPSESMREGNREFGVLVDPLDPGDIAKGILRLVGSNNEWGYFHERGKRRVFDRYTWEKTASGYLAVLMNLMSLESHKMIIPKYFMDPHPENEILLESFTSTWR